MIAPHSALCPVCCFSFAWDGQTCAHCPPPDRARSQWEQISRFSALVYSKREVLHSQLVAIVAGCLRRAWAALPASARVVTNALERRANHGELAAAAGVLGRDPAGTPQTIQIARVVTGLSEGAAHAKLVEVVNTVAEQCRIEVCAQTLPARDLLSFPLPPGLEQYRTVVAANPSFVRESGLGGTGTETASVRLLPEQLEQHSSIAQQFPICYAAFCRATTDNLMQQLSSYNRQRMQAVATEELAQCDIARDVLGYPGVRVPFDSAWCTSTAIALVRGMYQTSEYFAMPILADALQDAGCDDPGVLDHCRNDKPHSRGCWVCKAVFGEP